MGFKNHTRACFKALAASVEKVFREVAQLRLEVSDMASVLDAKIGDLKNQVTALKDVEDAAVALLNGIPKLIDAAVAAALAKGATDAQLQELTDLSAAIVANAAPLAQAVSANTPVVSPPVP